MLIMPSGDRLNCVVKYSLVKLFVPRQSPPRGAGAEERSYFARVEVLANMFVFQNW